MEAPVTARTKTFVAPTLRQALDAMRHELGEDALLLTTRSGIAPDGMPFAEVVGMASSRAARHTDHLVEAAGAPSFPKRPTTRTSRRESGEPIPLQYYIEHAGEHSNDAISELQEEIHRLSVKLTEITHAVAYRYSSILPDPYRRTYEMLREAGFAEQYAGYLIARIADAEPLATVEECTERLHSILSGLIQVRRLLADGVPPIIAFTGPSGSGKTTTLMKAALLLQRSQPELTIRLLSADTERIAAIEQLRSFGTLVGIEVSSIRQPSQFQAEPDSITLLDLPPPSARTAASISSFTDAVEQARGAIVFTLPATCDVEIARSMLTWLGRSTTYHVALTKLDEAPKCGHLLPLLWEHNIPLSLLTTGTRLPDDLVEPSTDRLMRFLFSSNRLPTSVTM